MDPNACLEEIRLLLSEGELISDTMARINYEEACEKFEALDTWLKNGGFLPERWTFAQTPPAK